MFINSYYNSKDSTIHIWEQIDGKDNYFFEHWIPYVFIETPVGKSKTINNIPAAKRDFDSYGDYYNYCKNYHENIQENNVKPEIQYLAEKYHDVPDNNIPTPNLKIYYIDIEVHCERGFPHANLADHPVVLISVRNSITGKTVTFGKKEYTGDTPNVIFIHCPNESEMLKKFFTFIFKYPPHVISGWNINDFDITYLINRDKKINSGKHYNKMSPINIVRTWYSKKNNKLNIDIAGITILDYIDLYKWYSPNNLERYSLEYVSQFELGEGKLDYSDDANSLRELYNNDWNKYVDYNIVDCKRVNELGKKLGYIELVQSLSLLTRVPMRYYNTMVNIIEGALLVHYRRNNLCAPQMLGGSQETFDAAYVKEPYKGMHKWLFSVDIQSSYPSHIITLNMSTETYYGRIFGLSEDKIVEYMKQKEFPPFHLIKSDGSINMKDKRLEGFNKALKRKLFSIAPCGTIFVNGKPGIISTVERNIFEKRLEIRKLMEKLKGEEKERYRAVQLALKILLNSMFGCTAVPYSRYFNTNISKAITSCGRYTIKSGEKYANKMMNEMCGTNKDYAIYGDTDSVYISVNDYMNEITTSWTDADDNTKIDMINEASDNILDYINEKIYNEVQLNIYNSTVKDFRIHFAKEKIAKSGLFVAKKKYCVRSLWVEGDYVDKISVTGLEVVRGDSSEAVRYRLKNIMDMILKDKSEEGIIDRISKYKHELGKTTPEELAANIGVSYINKWLKDGKAIKGTPWHVKGVSNYRKLLEVLDLTNNYEDISEGMKVKVVYIKPNQWNMETISFYRWPKEFENVIQVDKKKMIDKFFIKKVGILLEPMNKMYMLSMDSGKSLGLFFS